MIADILTAANGVGHITLNRPQALHALNALPRRPEAGHIEALD